MNDDLEMDYNPHLLDSSEIELKEIPCEECSEYTIDFYSCPNNMIENKAVCLDCCECHKGEK